MIFLFLCTGVIELISEFVVCEKEQSLYPESARMLVPFPKTSIDHLQKRII